MVPLAAETIAHIGSFAVTNSLLNAWIAAVILIVGAGILRLNLKSRPGKFQNLIEMLFEFLIKTFDSVTHDRSRSKKFFPLVTTLFLFILLSNWLGQLPGTGSIGVWEYMHGKLELVPIFRPATADLNLTLALGLFSILATHIAGIATLGFFRHGNKFIQIGSLLKSFKKGPIAIMTACVEFAAGLIETAGEVARAISLSLRLFGNIFAGEVLITVMLGLAAFVVPLPFQALELLVGVIQATVFSLLVLVFLTLATEKPHGEHAEAAAGEHH
ncbi:MAG: synthase subunit a [Patescibacteria group bacterium]|jgi:F-type H+-transporting ATPase subunit a|nr:synthase subunit a [Patescibacteria group bacterium]